MQIKTGPCAKCGRLLRYGDAKKADAPGTISHRGNDMCDTCYMEQQLSDDAANLLQPLTPEEQEAVEYNKRGLMDYFASRRPYRIALGQKDFPDPFIVKQGQRKGGRRNHPSKPKAPCGTPAAYQRHIRENEPVDDVCRKAHTERARAYRAQKKAS